MKKTILIFAVAVIVALGAATIFTGLRVIAIGPLGDQPGKTVVVTGLGDVMPIDNPEAYCKRQGDEDETCPISFRLAIGREGNVIFELPYSAALYSLASNF